MVVNCLKVLKKLGMEFYLQATRLPVATAKGDEVTVNFDDPKGEKKELKGDYCLVAVGRIAYTDGLGLDKIGLTVEERGRKIAVDVNIWKPK